MADMDCILEIERICEGRDVGGIGVHLVALPRLAGTAMAAPVVGNHAIALVQKEHHLRVPIVSAERPAVMENNRLGGGWTPILVEDFGSVRGLDEWHDEVLFLDVIALVVKARKHPAGAHIVGRRAKPDSRRCPSTSSS
jgi:hypothetical protein